MSLTYAKITVESHYNKFCVNRFFQRPKIRVLRGPSVEIYFEKSILFKVPSTMLGNEPGPDDQKEVFKLHTRGRIDKEKWSQEFAPISRKIMK